MFFWLHDFLSNWYKFLERKDFVCTSRLLPALHILSPLFFTLLAHIGLHHWAAGPVWPVELVAGDEREREEWGWDVYPSGSFPAGLLWAGFLTEGAWLMVTDAVWESPPHSFGLWKHLPSLTHSELALLFTAQSCAISLGFPIPCPHQINSSFIKLSSYYPIRACHLVPARPLPNSVLFIFVSPGSRTAPFTPRALNKFRN